MDNRKQAMTELLAKVEAGECNHGSFLQDWRKETAYSGGCGVNAHKAYNGSLDAAKALHEAVLPGWEYGYDGAIAWVKRPGLRTSYRHSGNGYTARAWLIAIIKALIAKADA